MCFEIIPTVSLLLKLFLWLLSIKKIVNLLAKQWHVCLVFFLPCVHVRGWQFPRMLTWRIRVSQMLPERKGGQRCTAHPEWSSCCVRNREPRSLWGPELGTAGPGGNLPEAWRAQKQLAWFSGF